MIHKSVWVCPIPFTRMQMMLLVGLSRETTFIKRVHLLCCKHRLKGLQLEPQWEVEVEVEVETKQQQRQQRQ